MQLNGIDVVQSHVQSHVLYITKGMELSNDTVWLHTGQREKPARADWPPRLCATILPPTVTGQFTEEGGLVQPQPKQCMCMHMIVTGKR